MVADRISNLLLMMPILRVFSCNMHPIVAGRFSGPTDRQHGLFFLHIGVLDLLASFYAFKNFDVDAIR